MFKDEGGQVYPVEKHDHDDGCSCTPYVWTDDGISRRDLLAAMAMQGILSAPESKFSNREVIPVAQRAYQQADAMIEEGKESSIPSSFPSR